MRSSLLVPYPPLLWRVLRTTALVWLGFHLVLAYAGILLPNFLSAVVMVGVCALAVWLDLRRHAEHLFYANLGISPLWSGAVALGSAGTLELLLRAAARLLTGSGGVALLG